MGHPTLVFRPAHYEFSDNVPTNTVVFDSSEYKWLNQIS